MRSASAAYNYQMAKKDPGNFAHNAKYTIQLLHDSLQDLNAGLKSPKDLSKFVRNDSGHFNGAARAARRMALLDDARTAFEQVLNLDPENLTAHFNLALVFADLGDQDSAETHRALVEKYRPDDHAVERAVALHRRTNPAADHAAEPVAIYDLQRPDMLQQTKQARVGTAE